MVSEREKKVSDKLPKLMETIKKDWQMKTHKPLYGIRVVLLLMLSLGNAHGMCEPEPITHTHTR